MLSAGLKCASMRTLAHPRARLYYEAIQVRSGDQRCLTRNGSTQRSTVGLRIASNEKRTDEFRSCPKNTSLSLHSRGSSMPSMTGSWNWSSTSMNGRHIKKPDSSGTSSLSRAAALDPRLDAKCPIELAGVDCNCCLCVAIESNRLLLRSIRPVVRCVNSGRVLSRPVQGPPDSSQSWRSSWANSTVWQGSIGMSEVLPARYPRAWSVGSSRDGQYSSFGRVCMVACQCVSCSDPTSIDSHLLAIVNTFFPQVRRAMDLRKLEP